MNDYFCYYCVPLFLSSLNFAKHRVAGGYPFSFCLLRTDSLCNNFVLHDLMKGDSTTVTLILKNRPDTERFCVNNQSLKRPNRNDFIVTII